MYKVKSLNAMIILMILTELVFALDPEYPNTPFKEEMTDAPWVVCMTDTIPFLFMLKDGNTGNWLDELHCFAIYDISDGIKRYANGTRFTPQVNDCGLLCNFNLRCPLCGLIPKYPVMYPIKFATIISMDTQDLEIIINIG